MKVAVVGATGAVGETILRVLEERAFPVSGLGAFASRQRAAAARFRGEALDAQATAFEALAAYDVVLFAGGDDASKDLARALAEAGKLVADNSSTYRMAAGVPLVVPDVNPHALGTARLAPVANCSTIQLVLALKPVRDAAGLRSVRVATYQSVSGAGRPALERLESEERALFGGEELSAAGSPFPGAIARNVIPQIGSFDEAGACTEEQKILEETRKILELPDLHVAATTVRVPVRFAHSEAVFVETERETSAGELAEAIAAQPGVRLVREGIVTPRDVEGQETVYVARLRAEAGSRRHFQMWVVGDNLRVGAATTAVRLAELMVAAHRAESAA
ncbi:MAG TPA: aspartate-semialdehyde dehydrogenase [Candidatus Dormibacteraeota bacterium]|nr:aspartate-semialdehyde dehydrogenase [Candidatus Dormibacteraeota bacterium]